MKLKWFGHACFLITSSEGVRILTDPFDPSVGYKVPEVEADIVTTSHDHHDHNYLKAVKGDFVHFSSPGSFNEKGINIKGISTYHDNEQGKKRGKNVVFVYEVDGLKVCHLGDLGHILSDEQINEIGPVDVLLLPVGGTYTIDYKQAAVLVNLMEPKLVIPMHFKTPAMKFPIDNVDKFLANMSSVQSLGSQELVLDSDFSTTARVIVMEYE
ncbi:MAG TPA: MBL fold metallo-hydrolase [Clostridiales bacterium]|nr:MBL fold metallo-hydrolase [Clostridiales bacterium]